MRGRVIEHNVHRLSDAKREKRCMQTQRGMLFTFKIRLSMQRMESGEKWRKGGGGTRTRELQS